MIAVTRLDGRKLIVNADLIESIEQTPDTIISFTSGHKVLVRDHPDDLARRVIEYRRATLAEAAGPPAEPGPGTKTDRS